MILLELKKMRSRLPKIEVRKTLETGITKVYAMAWDRVGTLRKSKAGKSLVIVLYKTRYVANIDDVQKVLSGERAFASISKPPEDTG